MDMMITSNCELCDTHKTDLGNLKSMYDTIKTEFPDWLPEKQQDLVIMWFEKDKAKELTILIQSYKKTNIKEINK